MKKQHFLLLGILLLSTLASFSQQPVRWSYSSKKIGDKTYEIHLKAYIEPTWHIYAQNNIEDLGVPTSVKFRINPLVAMTGNVKEVGTLKKEKVEDVGELQFYGNEVDFVQQVTIKGSVKTNIAGTINYQACTDTHCLPPSTIPFSITLN